ncbi:hypothetical protein PAMP_008453 [Pampus punctatissimus]
MSSDITCLHRKCFQTFGGELIPDFDPCLLHLLLLAVLFVNSSSHPIQSAALCKMFQSIKRQAYMLMNFPKKLHDLTDDELINLVALGNRLDSLPNIQHTAAQLSSLTLNESLSQLYEHTQSFKLHADWLKTAKENVSLPSHSAEGISVHLLQLSNLIKASLHQINEEVPQLPSPSLPVVSTAFDVLRFSAEISEQLKVFCMWSIRVLNVQRKSHCSRH